jgi:hypothetical protein
MKRMLPVGEQFSQNPNHVEWFYGILYFVKAVLPSSMPLYP